MSANEKEKQKLLKRLQELAENEESQEHEIKHALKKSFAKEFKELQKLCHFQAKGTVQATISYRNDIMIDPFMGSDNMEEVVDGSDVRVDIKMPKGYDLGAFVSEVDYWGLKVRDICPENKIQYQELTQYMKQLKQKLRKFAKDNDYGFETVWAIFQDEWAEEGGHLCY